MSLTFGSLFAGIGGFDLGFERAGMVCKWQVEIDDYATQVLAKHWPDVRRWRDVRDFPPEPVDEWRVDVICGGPPCQPASYAGKRQGTADERWLWGETLRIIRHLRPRYAILENPPALLSLERGVPFGGIIANLAESGYCVEWDCLSACQFGATHLRRRLFIVAYTVCGRLSRFFWCKERRQRTFWESDSASGSNKATTWNGGFRPDYVRVANGLPHRVDRLRGLGNAVVPQVAEYIGRRIVEHAAAESSERS